MENKNPIFLDYNSGKQVSNTVIKEINCIMNVHGNYSSLHCMGRKANHYVNKAKNRIKKCFAVDEYEVIFTSSGTEANNLITKSSNFFILSTEIEHPSIMKNDSVNVNENGEIDLDDLQNKISKIKKPFIFSASYANHETGNIQNIEKISEIVHKYGGYFHSDWVQVIGKMNVNKINIKNIDAITISGHKIGAPGGIGALIKKKDISLHAMIHGGGQEYGYRGGTLSPAIMNALALAVEENIYVEKNKIDHMKYLRKTLESKIKKICKNAIIIGEKSNRLPNTSCIVMPNVPSSLQVMLFDMNNICISAGAACSSGYVSKSKVLSSMGFEKEAEFSVRFSNSYENTIEEINQVVKVWEKIYLDNKIKM